MELYLASILPHLELYASSETHGPEHVLSDGGVVEVIDALDCGSAVGGGGPVGAGAPDELLLVSMAASAFLLFLSQRCSLTRPLFASCRPRTSLLLVAALLTGEG